MIMAHIKKAQRGMYLTESGDTLRGKAAADAKKRVSYMTEGLEEMKQQRLKKSPKATPKNAGKAVGAMKKGGKIAKKGGSFPDLNKDGKITKADILKGRGVIAKKGTKMAKKSASKMPAMKTGGKMKNCRGGCY
tara:strand:+ start:916 stop:1317 length:402 start_codon:yes stop_codon:yes gene_type:complete